MKLDLVFSGIGGPLLENTKGWRIKQTVEVCGGEGKYE